MARALGTVAVLTHLALVAWLTLRPVSVPWVYGSNIRPLATIDRVLLADPVSGTRTIAGGLLLLAPLGLLLPMVSGRLYASTLGSFTRTVFFGAAVSFGIECWQTGVPGRVFDVDSVILNTLGVAVAHLAVVPSTRGRLRRRYESRTGRTAEERVRPVKAPTVGYEVAAHLHRGA
ncbi:VanZ family protein [Streptomyces capparidis]